MHTNKGSKVTLATAVSALLIAKGCTIIQPLINKILFIFILLCVMFLLQISLISRSNVDVLFGDVTEMLAGRRGVVVFFVLFFHEHV